MIIRGVDSDGDWLFGSGIQSYKKEMSAIMENVETRLKLWKGDSFRYPAEGVDWNSYLDIGTKDLLDSDIKRVILQSEGVIKIYSYTSTLDRDTRGLTVSSEILTIYGVDNLNLEV